MPNRDNLIPLTERCKEDAKRIRQKGAHAANKARRKKANLKKTIETLLALELPDSKLKDQLKEMGIDPTLEQGLTMSVLLKGIQRGDHKALETVGKFVNQADEKEQKARTERIKAETEKIKAETARKDGTADKEHAHSQTVAIAEMINNPEAERVLADFLTPRKDEEKEGEGE
jgi:hypothetical protein